MDEARSGGSKEREITYSLGAAARLTGLSPDRLRAWERRHGVVQPIRTAGGTRRYRDSDLERLRLLKAAVDAGHRIGALAGLDAAELESQTRLPEKRPGNAREAVVVALKRLDAAEAERLISLQLSALGPLQFGREFALPLLHEIGDAWASDRLCVASEHLGSGLLRSLLGAALRSTSASRRAPPIVFATPTGERHELGLLIAALAALGAGGHPLYLGADLPIEELVYAVEAAGAAALALGLVFLPAAEAERAARAARRDLPEDVELWLGGPRAREIELPEGATRIDSLGALDRRVARLHSRVGRGAV